mgnify:CR=1 FL=1
MKIKISDVVICILLILGALTVINISFYHFYRSIFGACICMILCCCCSARVFYGDNAKTISLLICFFALNILISIFNENAGIGATLNILLFICLHILMKINRVSPIVIKFLTCIYAIECLYIASISKGYGALHWASYVDGSNAYVNTNYMSYMICIMSFQVWAYLKNTQFGHRVFGKAISAGLLILNIWAISNLDSRSSYIAILFFFVLVYFYPNNLITKKNILLIYIFLLALSIIVPIIYVYMYKSGITINTVGAISKNTFTGRELIWSEYIRHFRGIKDWIFGLGSHTEIHGGADMHNMSLALIKNGGIISALLVYVYIGKEITKCLDTTVTKEKFMYLAAVLASLAIGFFESTFLTSQFFCIFTLLLYEASFTTEKLLLENEETYVDS